MNLINTIFTDQIYIPDSRRDILLHFVWMLNRFQLLLPVYYKLRFYFHSSFLIYCLATPLTKNPTNLSIHSWYIADTLRICTEYLQNSRIHHQYMRAYCVHMRISICQYGAFVITKCNWNTKYNRCGGAGVMNLSWIKEQIIETTK